MNELVQRHVTLVADCPVAQQSSQTLVDSRAHMAELELKFKKMNDALNRLEATQQDLHFKKKNNLVLSQDRIEALINGDEPGLDETGIKLQEELNQVAMDIEALTKARDRLERDIEYKQPSLKQDEISWLNAVYDALARRMFEEAKAFVGEYITPMLEVEKAAYRKTNGLSLKSQHLEKNKSSVRGLADINFNRRLYNISFSGDIPALPDIEEREGSAFLIELAKELAKASEVTTP